MASWPVKEWAHLWRGRCWWAVHFPVYSSWSLTNIELISPCHSLCIRALSDSGPGKNYTYWRLPWVLAWVLRSQSPGWKVTVQNYKEHPSSLDYHGPRSTWTFRFSFVKLPFEPPYSGPPVTLWTYSTHELVYQWGYELGEECKLSLSHASP